MNDNRRKSGRAIVFIEDKIVSMYREKGDRVYYTFPGGGMDEGETEQQCVTREVIEEFGMTVEPIKKVYVYESAKSIEHFYLCKWISGEFGSGEGEEYQGDVSRGVYKPTLIDVKEIPNLPLMPPEVAKAFVEDFNAYGHDLANEVKVVFAED